MPMGEGGEVAKSVAKESLEKHGGNRRKMRAAQEAVKAHNKGVYKRRRLKSAAKKRAAAEPRGKSGGLRKIG